LGWWIGEVGFPNSTCIQAVFCCHAVSMVSEAERLTAEAGRETIGKCGIELSEKPTYP
jgi:histone H3/H4